MTQHNHLLWADRKPSGALVCFVRGNSERAALKLTDPKLHDERLWSAKTILNFRGVTYEETTPKAP